MSKIAILAWAVVLAACTAAPRSDRPDEGDGPSPPAVAGPEQPSLYGRWRIVEVNGAPVRTLGADARAEPSVSFTADGFGGNSGCNNFGGLGLLVGERWFAGPPMSTLIGCGALAAQENAIVGVLLSGPEISWEGSETLVLRSARGSLRLGRIEASAEREAAKLPMPLAGTRWELSAMDGATIDLPGERRPARLTFEADRAILETPCGTYSSGWQQERGAVQLPDATAAARACNPALKAKSDAIARAVSGKLHYVTGPNGELVLASTGHWLIGRRDVLLDRDNPHLLSGRWRILSVDGTAAPASERPAELAFGGGGFAVWDGCRHSEGVAIVLNRTVFTHGSGVVSMANCPDDPIRTKINRIVGMRPRIGTTADGGVALLSEAGTLRLRQTSPHPFGTGVETRLRSGMAFDLLTGAAGGARLTIGPGARFDVTRPCGTMTGRWRNDSWAGGSYGRFMPDRLAPGCESEPGAMRLYTFFTGEVHAVVGPNRDIALFVSGEDALPARVSNAR